MQLPFILKHSFPPLTDADIAVLEKTLWEQFGYPPLPEDYKQFLLAHNGGYVSPGHIDNMEANYQLETVNGVCFQTPLLWARDNNKPVHPNLVLFYGYYRKETMDVDAFSDFQLELYEIVTSNEYSKHDFNVLPDMMMSIAKCDHIQAGDMLCLSLRDDEYGSVYYYYGMCYYPAKFHGDYYDKKKLEILTRYALTDVSDIDATTPLGKQIEEEIHRVPFVKVADSFGQFLDDLFISKT